MSDTPNSPPRHSLAPWIASALADLVGVCLLIGVQEPWTLPVAAAFHLAALLPIAFLRTLGSSEKTLALSLVLALPLAGPLLAVLALEHGDGDPSMDLLQAPMPAVEGAGA